MLKKRVPTEAQLTHKFFLSTGLGAAHHKTVYTRWRSAYLKKWKQDANAKTQ